MREIPGTLHAGGSPFAETRWSVVAACAQEEGGAARAALAQLCRDYWPPLYSFVRRRGHNPHDAQDFVQGFFVHLIESRAYARIDPRKGKFRAFLLAALKNFLADAWDHQNRQKRGGGWQFVLLEEELNAVEAICAREAASHLALNEERLFERRWAAALVGRAMRELQEEYMGKGGPRARIFMELKPFLGGGSHLPSQEAAAARLELPVETLRCYLSRMRARYREILRAQVARTIAKEENVDEELRHLCRVLTDPR